MKLFLQYIKVSLSWDDQLSWRVCECGDWKGQVEIKDNYREQLRDITVHIQE